jgi:hypothetical protein
MAESIQVSESHNKSKTAVFIDSSNTPDGVAELRARWEADLSRTELPPPPPEVHATKQEGIDVREQSRCISAIHYSNNLQAVKNFAKDHGYVLVIGHSYKDKVSIFVFAVICFPCPQPDVF